MTPRDSMPTPDPTILTTEQLLREVENAEKRFEAALVGIVDTTAVELKSIQIQFDLIERQRVEQKLDTATAVQAALAAAKEAVTEQTAASEKSIQKSENATAEQLRQLTATFTTANTGLTQLLNDLKERVTTIEGRKEGVSETQTQRNASVGLVVAAVGAGFAALGAVVAAVLALVQ